jgi:hypothetical protein
MPAGERIPPVSDENGTSARLRNAFADLGETAAPGPDCPEPDRLWAVATGEAPLAERHDIIAHMSSCASCAAAFRLARGLSQEQARTSTLLRFDRPWMRWSTAAAALAAAVLLAVLVPGLWRNQSAPYRGGEGQEIRSLMDDAVLPRDQAELRWSPAPPGSRYEVRVLTREGAEIAVESDLEAPRYRIPPSALAGVPAGTVLYWQVKAIRPDGKSSASKTFEVRLR